jgi:hypothetical protein
MKRSREVPIGGARGLGLGALAVISLTGCWQTLEAFLKDDRAADAACTMPATASQSRADFVRWAGSLVYEYDPARGRLKGFQPPPNGMARLELTSPDRDVADVRRGCVIGRIISNYADRDFGFIAGTTYIWADSSSPDEAQLIPDDGSTMTEYQMDILPMPRDGEPTVSALTPSKHVCEQCATKDWCVYPRDNLKSNPEALPSDLGGADGT